MSFEDQKCPACSSSSVFKIPSLSIEAHIRTHTKRAGKVVDSYISEVKKEIHQEKKDLKNREL